MYISIICPANSWHPLSFIFSLYFNKIIIKIFHFNLKYFESHIFNQWDLLSPFVFQSILVQMQWLMHWNHSLLILTGEKESFELAFGVYVKFNFLVLQGWVIYGFTYDSSCYLSLELSSPMLWISKRKHTFRLVIEPGFFPSDRFYSFYIVSYTLRPIVWNMYDNHFSLLSPSLTSSFLSAWISASLNEWTGSHALSAICSQ